VLRIIFFEKSGRHECLVEMDSRDQARYAKETLHGKFLTAIRSVVDVVYSNMTSLSINHNTPRAWDFVKETRYQDRQQPAYYEPERQERPQSAYYEPERYAPPPQQSHAYAPPISSMRPPARGYGSYEYDPYDYRPPSPPPPHSAPPPSSSYGYGMPRYDYEPQYLPPTSRGYSDQDIDLRPEPGQVLLVSNLDPEKVSDPNILYRLFGAYGNVVRVRILLNKPDTALVQFENSMFAQTARKYLDRFEFRGKKLSVSTSKYDEIAVSGSALSKGDFTKEYFNRSEHRYKMSDLETYRKNVVDPRKYLFVTGVKSASRSEIEEHFSKYGKVMHVELAENKPGICWIEMEDTDAAVEAIVNLHDSGFKTNFLRVSFSPKSDFRSYRQRKSSVDTRAFEKIEGKRSKRERADASDERQEESTSNHPEDPEDEHMKSLENVESVAETKSLDYSESVAEIARSEDSDQ
jgi:hnRNP-L/PTB/hephaestus splicing factor